MNPKGCRSEPTAIQRQVLDFVREHVRTHLRGPTLREIATATGLGCRRNIAWHLLRLRCKGLVGEGSERGTLRAVPAEGRFRFTPAPSPAWQTYAGGAQVLVAGKLRRCTVTDAGVWLVGRASGIPGFVWVPDTDDGTPCELLITTGGKVAATVWGRRDGDGYPWHTWDENGIGGENSAERTPMRARAEAERALVRQGWHGKAA